VQGQPLDHPFPLNGIEFYHLHCTFSCMEFLYHIVSSQWVQSLVAVLLESMQMYHTEYDADL